TRPPVSSRPPAGLAGNSSSRRRRSAASAARNASRSSPSDRRRCAGGRRRSRFTLPPLRDCWPQNWTSSGIGRRGLDPSSPLDTLVTRVTTPHRKATQHLDFGAVAEPSLEDIQDALLPLQSACNDESCAEARR